MRDARFDAVLVNEATLSLSRCLIFNSSRERCRARIVSIRIPVPRVDVLVVIVSSGDKIERERETR